MTTPKPPTPEVPAGYVLVPVRLTDEMIEAYFVRMGELGFLRGMNASAAWAALLSPVAPVPGGGND